MKKSQIILIGIASVFVFLAIYIPHYVNPFPVHIDEWHHITEALKLRNGGHSLGWNSTELGFHLILMVLSYFVNLVLFYQYLPAIWGVITALVLFFVVYRKTGNNFYMGIFSMLFYTSLKSNVNILGIWFFTPLTFAIPFIFLYVYFFTEGIEKQNKKFILISLIIMAFLIPIHSISVLFAIPFFLIYTFINYNFLKKQWKFFIIFLLIPLIGILFYSFINHTEIFKSILEIIKFLQFKYGWGVLEIKNSPFEIYSLIGYIFAVIGVFSIFFLEKEHKKYIPYLIWPITLIASIIIFRIIHVSYLSPYQRNLYYFAISLPFLSAIGLYHTSKFLEGKIRVFIKNERIRKILLIILILIIFFFVFNAYFEIPKNTLLYKLIDNNDYEALKFLSKFPKATLMASPSISTAAYQISGQNIIAGIFQNSDNKEYLTEFFKKNTNCTRKKEIIKQFNVTYILSKNESVNCNWTMIYNKTGLNSSDFIYKPNDD